MSTTQRATDEHQAVLQSIALDCCPRPDFADAQLFPLPADSSADPAEWARLILDPASRPAWVGALTWVRNLLVAPFGIARSDLPRWQIDERAGNEVVSIQRERHLDFWASVAVDRERKILQVASFVTLKGWLGRIYFIPVSVLHAPVVRSQVNRAINRSTSMGDGRSLD